ncbi:MAG: oxygenase MpaB family protein [Streptosporangiaceae bacterium]
MRLSASELDQFVAEQRRSAAVVGLESASVPGGMAELDGYYDAMQPRLHACAEAWQV